MADPKSVFNILGDTAASDTGLSWSKVLHNDPFAGKNAGPVLTFRNAANNLRYALVDAQDRVMVNSDEGDTACLSASGELAAGSVGTLVEVTNAEILLQTAMEYEDIGFVVSCRRDSLFQIVWDDDGAETVLAEAVVGAGAYTVGQELHCLAFTSGATGTQRLIVKAKQFEGVASSLRATITVTEIQ